MNKKLLALYGLKWNPFSPELPTEALYLNPKTENFCWRIEQALVREGGFALIQGDPGTGIEDRRGATSTEVGGDHLIFGVVQHAGQVAGLMHVPTERNPLEIVMRVPEALRSSPADLSRINVKGRSGNLVSLGELGDWREAHIDQTIYHKNLERVMYVTAETAGRPPAGAPWFQRGPHARRSRQARKIRLAHLQHGQ